MPWHPLKRCTYAGCKERVKSGRCKEHRQQQDAQRGSRRERGYTAQWDKYRLIYLKAHPLCVHCEKKDIYTPAKIVDHIIPINGADDVLFWPETNHQGLCMSCHSRKTTTQDPMTKQQRKAGRFQRLEEAAAHRWDWAYKAREETK
ncbi:HNH endonuclease signature motif containing protein [Ewingella sp. AOP8-B2-18]